MLQCGSRGANLAAGHSGPLAAVHRFTATDLLSSARMASGMTSRARRVLTFFLPPG